MGCFSNKSSVFPVVVSQARWWRDSCFTLLWWDAQPKERGSQQLRLESREVLAALFSLRDTGKYCSCLPDPWPFSKPWSGSSKTLEPMAVAGRPFWRLSSSEDHPLSTGSGQSLKQPLFIFLERKRLFRLSKALMLFSVGWGNRCLIPSAISGPEDLMSRLRVPPRLVFKSSSSFMFPDRQSHSIDKQWHSNPERTNKCRSLLHWPSPFLTCWMKYGENTNWFPPFGSNGPVALGIFPSIMQVWHAALTAGSLWSPIYHVK